MAQLKSLQRFLVVILAGALFGSLSTFADDRPDWRTDRGRGRGHDDGRYERDRGDLVGTVVDVAGDGDHFSLRTRRGTVRIEAKGGVPAYYQGRRYRIRDLDRGDYVSVDLRENNGRQLRARSVQILENRGGRYDDRRYDDRRYDDRRYDDPGYGYDQQRLYGRVVSLDVRRDLMIVRTGSRDVAVSTRQLERRYGTSWARSLRQGEAVSLSGYFDGRTFVASAIRH